MRYSRLILPAFCVVLAAAVVGCPRDPQAPLLSASFTVDPTVGVAPLTVVFTDTSTTTDGAILSRDWNFGDGNTGSGETVSHTFAAPGFYTVGLTVRTENAIDVAFNVAAVHVLPSEQPPLAAFTVKTLTSQIPLVVQFRDRSVPGSAPIDNWFWDFGDGALSTQRNPVYAYETPGIYTVSLTVESRYGADTQVQEKAVVVQAPAAAPSAAFVASPLSGDAPLQVAFSDRSDAGDAPIDSWMWEFGDGETSTAQNPLHTYAMPGSYDVRLTVGSASGMDSVLATDYITVFEPVVEGEPGGEGEVPGDDEPVLLYQREFEQAAYRPGEPVTVTVNIENTTTGIVRALALEETLPPGWTFQGISGGSPPNLVPQVGTGNSLVFIWFTVPGLPTSFRYEALPPPSASGQGVFVGFLRYRGSGGEEVTELVIDGIPQAPEDPEGEGEGEGEEPFEGEPSAEGEVEGEEIFEGEDSAEGEGEEPFEGEPSAEGEGEEPFEGEPSAEGEGEGEEPFEGEPSAEGEGEPGPEGEPSPEGEGEGEGAEEGEPQPEGEGEGAPDPEGEGEPAPEGEGESEGEELPFGGDPLGGDPLLYTRHAMISSMIFTPGDTIVVETVIEKLGNGPVNDLTYQETLPVGWGFAGMETKAEKNLVLPPVGADGSFTFTWTEAPTFPVTLRYGISTPVDATEARNLRGVLTYRGNGPERSKDSALRCVATAANLCGFDDGDLANLPQVRLERIIVSGSPYEIGEPVDVLLTISQDGGGPLSALAVEEVVPPGWRFEGVLPDFGVVPPIVSTAGLRNPVEFAFILIPNLPVQIGYRLTPRHGVEGPAQIDGALLYRALGFPSELRSLAVSTPVPAVGEETGPFVIRRTVLAGSPYEAGGTVDYEVRLEYTGEEVIRALAVEETLPDGWSFDRMLAGDLPQLTPQNGAVGVLPFAYFMIPEFPIVFSYRVNVPASAAGPATVSGVALYRGSGEEEQSEIVTTTVMPG